MFLLRLFDAIPPEEREKAAKAMRSDLGGDLDRTLAIAQRQPDLVPLPRLDGINLGLATIWSCYRAPIHPSLD